VSDEEISGSGAEIDAAKRETLRKLGAAAWVVPVVATFAVGGLSMSSTWAIAANGTLGTKHS
jgi:hypothetical protein